MSHLAFWLKTFLHLIVPGGYGYNRRLRQQHDPFYDIDKDKHPVRKKHHGEKGWGVSGADDTRYRDYTSYEEYTTHQRQKFEEILKLRGGFSGLTIARWRVRFWRRFRHLGQLVAADARILCAGARQGTEVEVLRDLGFSGAYGIDLNPGPNNPFVRRGDFMKLEEAAAAVDLLYCNSVDHAYDLEEFFLEHARVLKPRGYALYDLARYGSIRSAGAFEAVSWDEVTTPRELMVKIIGPIIREVRDGQWHWLLLQRSR